MPIEILLALVAFAFVTTITPGPNNAMLLASGINFGFRRTVPHIFGITGGFATLVVTLGMGLSALGGALPQILAVLRWVSAGYLLWLAWRIARAGSPEGKARARPFGFLQAAAFQWVNPKAWIMIVGGLSAYAPGAPLGEVLLVALIFACVGLPCIAAWAGFGTVLRRWLTGERSRAVVNYAMAALLVLSLYPVLTDAGF